MANYYNKTPGPIAVPLRRGGVLLIGSKKWQTIDPEDDGHASLVRDVNKGYLVRGKSTPAPVPVPAPVAVVVSEVQTVPPAEPEPVKAAPVAPVVRSGKKGR
jgi:hypothetical protein